MRGRLERWRVSRWLQRMFCKPKKGWSNRAMPLGSEAIGKCNALGQQSSSVERNDGIVLQATLARFSSHHIICPSKPTPQQCNTPNLPPPKTTSHKLFQKQNTKMNNNDKKILRYTAPSARYQKKSKSQSTMRPFLH